MASFLGNLNWDKLADVLGYAAEMHRPGGNVQRYEQNRLAQKILQDKLKEQEAQKAAKARLMGGMDPTTGITWNTGRQAPASVQRINIPEELQSVPRVSGKPMDPAMMMEDDQTLADARRQFGKQRQADIAQAFPDLAEQQIMAQFAPPKMQTVGKTLGRVDADGTFTPVYRDPVSDISPAEQARLDMQQQSLDMQGKRLDAMTASQAAEREARSRPQGTTYVSRITGQPVRYNPGSGAYLDGEQTIGAADLVPATDFNKQVETGRAAISKQSMADNLLAEVDANPTAFDKSRVREARLKSNVPFLGEQYAAAVFTPEENTLRAKVARDAAMIINELYGAALSAGESERAKTFTPSPDDELEQLIPKLRAAREWAATQTKNVIPSALEIARRQIGGGDGQQPQVIDFNALPKRGQK